MRLNPYYLFAVVILLLPGGRLLAESSSPDDTRSATITVADLPDLPAYHVSESFEEFVAQDSYTNPYLEFEEVPETNIVAARFGWWGVSASGSKRKTGEYQWLDSSAPFIDIDGLFSNGVRTLDIHATGLERDVAMAGFRFYNGPGLSASIDYDRYVHRLDHYPIGDPAFDSPPNSFSGFFTPWAGNRTAPAASTGQFAAASDLNPGRDYAIRVQELKANFKGELTENIRWRLNVWGLEKDGARQTHAMAHCYAYSTAVVTNNQSATLPASRCHVVNQAQQIDWLTMQLEPVIEARVTDWLTLEYSHTLRVFQQSDQLVTRDFNASQNYRVPGVLNGPYNDVEAAFAYVPENRTDIDRLKVGAQLGPCTDMYVLGFVGNNHNDFRDINRHFGGVDARVTNQSFEGLSLTGYGKVYTEHTSVPPALLTTSPWVPVVTGQDFSETAYQLDPPTNRDDSNLGLKGRWRPFEGDCDGLRSGLALDGGYEYRKLRRSYPDFTYPGWLSQPTTSSNRVFAGVSEDWTCALTSYVRATSIWTAYPLYGVTPTQPTLDNALNSNLPTRENRIEVGSTWTPTDNFMLNGTFYIENLYNHTGGRANFDEDNYPFTVTAWYAPTCKWSLSAGYAQMTNWINQDITLGNMAATAGTLAAYTSPWSYMGRSDVVTLGTSYALTERTTLTGGFEYVRARNAITNIPNNGAISYMDIANLNSRVSVDTYRASAGMDYLLRQNVSTFFRYNYFDYGDFTQAYNSGEAHMFLAGLTGTY